ncbi:hypothetical protein EYF80_022916 [Liparis tanakae]|uniref:Uncharacterized protein n=1 Tax=Liparis tanakae TaxID=230148 RepID=A0A4Z2HM65_9TELE|nr:hypothetical protein EYF80_022916 [Liparis tanakae]
MRSDLRVREDAALVDPVVVVGAEEEDGEVADVVAEALNVGRHQARVADLRWPPPARGEERGNNNKTIGLCPVPGARCPVPGAVPVVAQFDPDNLFVSLQDHAPAGVSISRHSGWKEAGHVSQHSNLPPTFGRLIKKVVFLKKKKG